MVFREDRLDRADWPLMQNGVINVFRKRAPFEKAITDLSALGYHQIYLAYTSMTMFRNELSAHLQWETQFGYTPWNGNLNALNDGFRDFPFAEHRDSAVIIDHFDRLVEDDGQTASALLDIIAYQSRQYLLFGKRLLALIRTDDPDYHVNNLGGTSSHWNGVEWLRKDRD